MEALQHLVDDDPEALVDGRLLRDPEDARELVLERADPVRVDVARGQHEAAAAAWDERIERGLGAVAVRRGAALRVTLGVAQPAVERRLLEDAALLGRRALDEDLVDLRERVVERLALPGALDQGGDLDQLEVA